MLAFCRYLKFDRVIYDMIGRTWINSEISVLALYLGVKVKHTKRNQAHEIQLFQDKRAFRAL